MVVVEYLATTVTDWWMMKNQLLLLLVVVVAMMEGLPKMLGYYYPVLMHVFYELMMMMMTKSIMMADLLKLAWQLSFVFLHHYQNNPLNQVLATKMYMVRSTQNQLNLRNQSLLLMM